MSLAEFLEWLDSLRTALRWFLERLDKHHDGLGVIALVAGGVWALLVFARDRRAKASELVLRLEEEYKKHLETFLQVEYSVSYQTNYESAIKKMNDTQPGILTADETIHLDRLESALRYLAFCAHLERLGIDSGLLGQLNRYYLDVFIRSDRTELRVFIKEYWPGVWKWAHLAGRNAAQRLWRVIWLSLGLSIKPPTAPHQSHRIIPAAPSTPTVSTKIVASCPTEPAAATTLTVPPCLGPFDIEIAVRVKPVDKSSRHIGSNQMDL